MKEISLASNLYIAERTDPSRDLGRSPSFGKSSVSLTSRSSLHLHNSSIAGDRDRAATLHAK